MAGSRIGYAIGEAGLSKAFDKIRNHFGINRIAQIGALASLKDKNHLPSITAIVAGARERIVAIAADNGLSCLPSATNFVAIDCGSDGDFARKVLAGLVTRGVFVRMPSVAPQDRCIRVSAGTASDLDAFAQALPPSLTDAQD